VRSGGSAKKDQKMECGAKLLTNDYLHFLFIAVDGGLYLFDTNTEHFHRNRVITDNNNTSETSFHVEMEKNVRKIKTKSGIRI
jgi:hypothetical protein